ncbi:MAG: putative membrane protein YfcA [Parvibaculaceae bacterium]|nr:sulfite exporter TauE/SafE family protein [Parvibaculaceae bacterium]
MTVLLNDLFGLTPFYCLMGFLAVAFAGGLRAFSGFGFALAGVPLLALIFGPAQAVPIVLVLEVIGGLQMVPMIRKQVDWGAVGLLIPAALVGAPLGVWALSVLSPDWLRLVIAVALAGAVIVIATGARLPANTPRKWVLTVGGLSGLMAGSTAMSGPPVLVYFMARADEASRNRASMMMYFLFISTATVAVGILSGVVTWQTVAVGALFSPALIASNLVGHWLFGLTRDDIYRRISFALLCIIAAATLFKAIIDLI